MRTTWPSFSIAFRSFSLTTFISAAVVVPSYRTQVRPRRSLGSFAPFAWMMKVRRIPRTPPKRPASNTTLSRGEACRAPVRADVERGEIDLMRELDEALERGGPRLEGCRPGIYVRDAFQTACQRLQQFSLFS